MSSLALDVDDGIARVTIHRPEKRNALTQAMWEELGELVESVATVPGPRVLKIVSDVPGVFSAGADIAEYRAAAGDVAWGMASQARLGRTLGALRAFPAPTIAVINGACVGGGSGIALACDFRIATEEAFFAITPGRLGMVFPYGEIAALVALVGGSNAKRILLTGARFDAEWALRVGFVDEVHRTSELEAGVAALVAELMSVAPQSARMMKRMIGMVESGIYEPTPEVERLVETALASQEHREAVNAFLDGRAPDFSACPR